MSKSQQGFTLIELIIVIAILSIFFGMAAIRIADSVANNNLNSAAAQMAFDIRKLQELSLQKAATGNMNINMTITSNTYQITNINTQLPQVSMPQYVTITTTGLSPLTYDPYTFSNNKENMIVLTSERIHQTRTIVLAKETGRIRIDSNTPAHYRAEEK